MLKERSPKEKTLATLALAEVVNILQTVDHNNPEALSTINQFLLGSLATVSVLGNLRRQDLNSRKQ